MADKDNIVFIDATKFAEAYEAFSRGQQGIVDRLYASFHEFNEQHWRGQLPRAIIRIPSHGMTRRTLGRYTLKNEQGEEHVVEINKDFVVLNTWTRVLETLRHEMIHLYLLGVVKGRGCMGHGKKFKAEADRVGIPCEGPRGYGNPANMPAPLTNYTEWRCACNTTVVRAGSRREVHAICDHCWSPLRDGGYVPGDYQAPSTAPINGGESLLTFLVKTIEAASEAVRRLAGAEAERDRLRQEAQDLFAELMEVSMLAVFADDDPFDAARRRAEATADAATARGADPSIVRRFAAIFSELDVPNADGDDLIGSATEARVIDLEPEVTVNGKPLRFEDDDQRDILRAPVDLEPAGSNGREVEPPATNHVPFDLD